MIFIFYCTSNRWIELFHQRISIWAKAFVIIPHVNKRYNSLPQCLLRYCLLCKQISAISLACAATYTFLLLGGKCTVFSHTTFKIKVCYILHLLQLIMLQQFQVNDYAFLCIIFRDIISFNCNLLLQKMIFQYSNSENNKFRRW